MSALNSSITNSTASFFRNSQTQMDGLRAEAGKLQSQISTGERLERPSDDPVASSRLRNLSRTDRLAQIGNANAARIGEELSTASNALEDIANAVIRARELTLQAASGATSDAARILISDEIGQLRENILASANTVGSLGRSLFGGETSGPAYAVDAVGAASYAGTPTSGDLAIADGVNVERGLTGPALFEFGNGGIPADLFAFLATLTDGLRGAAADPTALARDSIGGLDSALDSLNRGQTILGARLAWIDNVEQSQILRGEARAQEGGDIGGTDLASAIARLQQTLAVLEASQASFARLSSLSLFEFI